MSFTFVTVVVTVLSTLVVGQPATVYSPAAAPYGAYPNLAAAYNANLGYPFYNRPDIYNPYHPFNPYNPYYGRACNPYYNGVAPVAPVVPSVGVASVGVAPAVVPPVAVAPQLPFPGAWYPKAFEAVGEAH